MGEDKRDRKKKNRHRHLTMIERQHLKVPVLSIKLNKVSLMSVIKQLKFVLILKSKEILSWLSRHTSLQRNLLASHLKTSVNQQLIKYSTNLINISQQSVNIKTLYQHLKSQQVKKYRLHHKKQETSLFLQKKFVYPQVSFMIINTISV